MGSRTEYFLKISGEVTPAKQHEFEQTVRFVFNNLPPLCASGNLAHDVHHKDLYHFLSQWRTREDLKAFTSSQEFSLLHGAFQALGEHVDFTAGKTVSGQMMDVEQVLS